MDISTFILAGLIALFAMALFLQIIMRLFPKLYQRSVYGVWMTIGAIYAGFNILYFTNAIPPVPLVVKEIGVYHSVVRANEGYLVRYENPRWYEWWRTTHSTYHRAHHEAAYCFSAVFAPTRLTTEIFHSWQRLSDDGVWIRETRIPYTIAGGRDEGYRGYTIKSNLAEGRWRCVVETERQDVVGETRFRIVNVDEPVGAVTEMR